MKLMVLQAGALENEVSNSISDMGHQHYFEGQPGHVKTSSIVFSASIYTLSHALHRKTKCFHWQPALSESTRLYLRTIDACKLETHSLICLWIRHWPANLAVVPCRAAMFETHQDILKIISRYVKIQVIHVLHPQASKNPLVRTGNSEWRRAEKLIEIESVQNLSSGSNPGAPTDTTLKEWSCWNNAHSLGDIRRPYRDLKNINEMSTVYGIILRMSLCHCCSQRSGSSPQAFRTSWFPPRRSSVPWQCFTGISSSSTYTIYAGALSLSKNI